MKSIVTPPLIAGLLCGIALLHPLQAAEPQTALLSLNVTGLGRVVSDPPGISCPGSCEAEFPAFSNVELRAKPDKGESLLGWTGPCILSATRNCRIYMDGEKIVQTAFSVSL